MSAFYLGIDLGTTNSVAALGSSVGLATPVRVAEGGVLLPSVVRIDARGTATVGGRARRFLESDPENTRGEFKRLMGSGKKLSFRAAKADKTPEELSALVLASLRSAAEQALGHPPQSCVITVPALFELPQTRATSEAARLAGFDVVEHLQEPVASALTAGWKSGEDAAPWLVYDLGGGTFDVSLLETREGVLRVVDHDGDNFLGGRDMDTRLLEHVLAALGETYGRPFQRSDPALVTMARRLRSACEDAKLELGAGREAAVTLPEPIVVAGDEIVVDVPIDVKTFEAMVGPIVDRSADICLRLLARQGLEPAAVSRIVLVGGPTVMGSLRQRLVERLGIRLAADVDPMTAVAEGAALFAMEHDLTTSTGPRRADAKRGSPTPAAKAESLWLQYPSTSGDLHPYVVGRAPAGKIGAVKIERTDGAFASAEESLDEDGAFVVQVELRPRALCTFRITAKDRDGRPVLVTPDELTIRHGLSLADPPLSRTIGIALADGDVAVYFERGAPLPSRKTFRLRTSFDVRPGEKATALTVPIVQGEVERAHLCRLVGTIELRADALDKPLPSGSAVDVVLELDRGGKLTAAAHVPDRGVSFPGSLVLVAPDTTADELTTRLAALRKTTEELYTDPRVDAAGKKRLVAVDGLLEDADREVEPARGGDADASEKLRRLLIEADGELTEVEARKVWPDLEDEAAASVSAAIHWVSRAGGETERRALDEAIRSLERARARKSAADFGKRLSAIRSLCDAAFMRTSEGISRMLDYAEGRIAELRDPRAGRALIEKGRAAFARSNLDEARKHTYAVLDLMPPEEQVRAKAHGSGVER